MTFTIDRNEDQAERVWSHFPNQHINTPDTEAFVKAFNGDANVIHEVNWQLLNLRWLDSAEGKQLDGIGEIVGMDRALKEGVVIPFFGFASQPAGRGFGKARIRRNGEGYFLSYSLPDPEYKILLAAKIIKNNSHGTINEIIESAKILYQVPTVKVETVAFAELTLTIPRAVTSDEILYRIRPSLLPVNGVTTLNIISG